MPRPKHPIVPIGGLPVRADIPAEGARPGYPALLGGRGNTMQTAAEIAALGAVGSAELVERFGGRPSNRHEVVRKLVVGGLVRQYAWPTGPKSPRVMTLDQRHPHSAEVEALALCVADTAGIASTPGSRSASKFLVGSFGIPPLGEDNPSFETSGIFGSAIRTDIIVVVALVGTVDPSAVMRGLGRRRQLASDLFPPLERDGILVREDKGQFKPVSLAEVAWRDPLVALCRAIARAQPRYIACVAATKHMMVTGTDTQRKSIRPFYVARGLVDLPDEP